MKVEYNIGSKVYIKELRPNLIVGMKGLAVSGQILNRVALANEGVTIYDYELNTYFNRGYNGAFAFGTSAATYAFQFIPHNAKREAYTNYNAATMSAGTVTLQGLVA